MDHNPHYLQHALKQPGIKIRTAYEGNALNLHEVVGKTKYDVILMQGVGQDFCDDQFRTLLNNCKEQLRPGG